MTSILRFPQSPENAADEERDEVHEVHLAARHPISRWYVCPLVGVIAQRLVTTGWRPLHVTVLGVGLLAVAVWLISSGLPMWGALVVWLAWCCDRLDGVLARAQQTTTRWGAWLDANVDEAGDIALHAALAAGAALQFAAAWPWALFAVFVGAKYLWQYGIKLEAEIVRTSTVGKAESPPAFETQTSSSSAGRLQQLFHLLGNADVRIHFLIGTLAFARPDIGLMFASGYFGCRALARAVRVYQRFAREVGSPGNAATTASPQSSATPHREAA